MCENYVILIKTILGGAAMRFEDEKDYIMRMIKEMVSVLFCSASNMYPWMKSGRMDMKCRGQI